MGRTVLRPAAVALLLLGCAGAAPPTALAPEGGWSSGVAREHPLVGRIFAPATGRFVAASELVAELRGARFVLLGEKHDNADHHRLQAWLVEQLATAGRRPGVAFEMLASDKRAALLGWRSAHPHDVDGLAAALDWAGSGWPEWSSYRPIFAAALAADLPIEPADLPRDLLRELRARGLPALGAETLARLSLDVPLDTAEREELVSAIRSSHCGMLPEAKLEPMIDTQRARDAFLADGLLRAAGSDGAVLIAGVAHARRNAVAAFLRRRVPDATILAVALLEVEPEQREVAGYLDTAAGFDLLWFTPRVDAEDPCQKFRQQLERLRG